MKVLLIEDDPGIIDVVTLTLELRWSDVNLTSTFSGEKGVELVKTELPDLIILDLGLPDTDGFQVLRRIRAFSDVPVVILTVRGEELDKIRGLELGADDYILKPFSPGELLARMQALLRRSHATEATAKVGDRPSIRGKLRIDFSSREVSLGNKALKLGPREYDLLYHLVTNEGKVLSNEMLLQEVFPEHEADTTFLNVYIRKLRERLEDDPGNPRMILNEGDIGYKFVGG
ncbi:response regulator transcription factor [Chloroflexota bacterium]